MKTKKQGAQKAPMKKDGRRALAVGTGSESSPITRKITRIGDGSHVGWSLYVEDYERAVMALASVGFTGAIYGEKEARKMWAKLMPETRESWIRSARIHLAAIGVCAPNVRDEQRART